MNRLTKTIRPKFNQKIFMSTITQNETKNPQVTAAEQSHLPQHYVSPHVNIFENNEGYVLEAELPGVAKTGLEIGVENNLLTIIGQREKNTLTAEPIYRELSTASYRRVFELDPAIDTEKIDARLEQGVLTVRLPKSDRAKPRKVQVGE
jgi:HSP20 family protein